MENKIQKIICPLCDSDRTSYFSTKNNYKLYKCLNCKLLFIYPVPNLIELYDDSYFKGAEKGFGYVDYDADKEPMTPTFNKYLDLLAKYGADTGKLLDIGAATGFFLNIAKQKGFDTVGVEFSDFAAKQGRSKGLNIITGDLISQNFPSESFDVVTMFDVLEHVPNPKEIIFEVNRILKKDGFLLVNTPDAQSLWARVLGKRWQLIVPPEHINYFSPKNLGDFLSKKGFSVLVSTKIGKSFTIQYILKTLYKWTKIRLFLSNIKTLSKISLPINLRDNFFMIAKKND